MQRSAVQRGGGAALARPLMSRPLTGRCAGRKNMWVGCRFRACSFDNREEDAGYVAPKPVGTALRNPHLQQRRGWKRTDGTEPPGTPFSPAQHVRLYTRQDGMSMPSAVASSSTSRSSRRWWLVAGLIAAVLAAVA